MLLQYREVEEKIKEGHSGPLHCDLFQDTNEWLDLRQNYIGASDAPVIMGVSPWKTLYQLWEEKVFGVKHNADNFATRRGTALEPEALAAYNNHTDNDSVPMMVFNGKYPHMMATLDGLCHDFGLAVEIKCPGINDHELAAKGFIPEKYYPQLQHQLAVNEHNVIHYFSYYDGEFVLIEVQRDEPYIRKLLKKEEDFWELVKNMEAPPMDSRDFVKNETPEWTKAADNLKRIQASIDEINERLSTLKEEQSVYKQELITLSGDQSCVGAGVKLQKVVRRGNVDYKKIPQLVDIDIDIYRKPSQTIWMVKVE